MTADMALAPTDRAYLRALPMFSALNGPSFETVVAATQALHLPAKTPLFTEGQAATDIYAIQSGWVKLFRTSGSDVEAIISLLPRGSSVGEAVSLLRKPYPASAETITEARLLRVSGARLVELLRDNPGMAAGMMAAMSRQLHQLVGEITRLKALNGTARVLDFLVEAQADQNSLTFALPFEKQLIAKHLSMQPESLSRNLRTLRKFGIRVDGRTVTLATPDAMARAEAELSA